MNKKKLLPLAALGVGIAVLAVLLAVLQLTQPEESTDIALCDFAAEEIDKISYAGNNAEATLIKGSEGNWMLESDPAVPLDQTTVQSLVEQYATLTAERQLTDSELGELPAQSETPAMRFEITAGETTRTLTADQLNEVASVYYVYDENGTAYTVAQSDLIGACPSMRSLYAPQTLTEFDAADVTTMEMNGLHFTKGEDDWYLTDDPDYPLDQSSVNKMARTVCELETAWTITSPTDLADYGLDEPDIAVTLTFTDGTTLTANFGALTTEDDTLCYLQSSAAPTVVYEVNATHKDAYAVTKESLYSEPTTPETADDSADVVAEHPVGGADTVS